MRDVPEGYHTVTPWIIVRGTAKFLDYLRDAFGAEELARIYNEDGVTIGHAEARIGDSVVMMFEEVAPEELARRTQEEKYLDAMRYVQESLHRELSGR